MGLILKNKNGNLGRILIYLDQPASGIDADAQAFITAASITDPTQQSAINTLVTDLKTYSLWTKMKAIYPFVGGTATTHKWNLKDPRDLNAAFRLVFNGGWTHSSNGALPNGTNGYADTFLTPSTVLTSPFLGYYSRTNANTGTDQIDMGSKDSSNRFLWISAWYNGSGYSNILARNSSVAVLLDGGTTTDSRGWYWTNKISTTAKLGKNSTILTSATDTQTPPSIPTSIGKLNVDTGVPAYTNRQTAFSVIADGMSDTDTTNLYTAVQKFNTTLNRYVGVPIVSDSDAQSFLNAAEITDITQANAINQLVTELKNYGIWTKMKAIYPFVGGTATTHKFNLKDPRDLDNAFRLVFNGGWTHSSNGALPNGTTGYADTKFIPNTHLNINNTHLSYYSRTDQAGGSIVEIGCSDNANELPIFTLYLKFTDGKFISLMPDYNLTDVRVTNTNTTGFYIGSRTANNIHKIFKNGTQVGTTNTSTLVQTQLPTKTLPLGAYHYFNGFSNVFTGFSSKQVAFSTIGDGLTDTEASNLYTAVQNFNTTLNRQV